MTGSDPKSDPSNNPKVATHITNGKYTQKLLINPTIPVIIVPINQLVTDNVTGIQDILGLRQTVLPKLSVTDAAGSCARIFQTPRKVLGKIPNFVGLGLSPAHTTDKLKSVIVPITRV